MSIYFDSHIKIIGTIYLIVLDRKIIIYRYLRTIMQSAIFYNLMDNARKKAEIQSHSGMLICLLTMMPFLLLWKPFHVSQRRFMYISWWATIFPSWSADKCAICLFTLSSFTEPRAWVQLRSDREPRWISYPKGEGHYCYFSPIVSPRSSCPTITIPLMGCMHYKMTCERGMLCPWLS